MKFSSSVVLAAVAASVASAQDYTPSKPFSLQLNTSDANANLTGKYLYSCHAGAAIEQLCVGAEGTSYTLNETSFNNVSSYPTGPLVYILPTTDFNVSSGLNFFYNPTSNVAVPVFQPSSGGQYVGFDKSNKMFIGSLLDEADFVAGTPPNATAAPTALYNWYACWTYNTGYYYQALAWVTAGKPINPTCVKVDVLRKFL